MTQNIIEQNIVKTLTSNYMPYTAYVIMERALPEIDGLKPSQRRILYTMYKMGLLKGARKKSQGVVGQTMFLHPHGDMAIYETLVRMSKDAEALLIPFIDSKGNFGKQYSRDMKYASARYCVTKDTLVNTNKGLLYMDEIVENSELDSDNDINITVESFNGKKSRASKFFNSGKHKIIEMITKRGYSVKGTDNHPIMCLVEENGQPSFKWKTLGEITTDDYIVLNRSESMIESETDLVSVDEARFLGGMVSEGYISNPNREGNYYRVGFNNTNYKFVNDMKCYFSQFLPNSVISDNIKDGTNKNYREIYIHSKVNYDKMINTYDFDFGSKDKSIPSLIRKSSKKIQKEFLSYLFEGDGCPSYGVDKRSKYFLNVSYSTSSKVLLNELKIMLLQFGVTSLTTKDKNGWKLEINGYLNVKRFYDNIGFAYEYKNSILKKAFNEINPREQQGGKNCVPFFAKYVRSRHNNKWLKTNNFTNEFKFQSNKSKLKDIITDDEFSFINNIFDNGYDIVKVDSIKDIGDDVVYSIHVDSDCHSFTANGLINHNTEVRLSDVSKEMFKDIDKNTVDMVDNYDGTMKEPKLFPVTFPSILTNPQMGIANGMASNIAPFNLNEIIDLTIAYIKNPKVEVSNYIKTPDFPTGGTIVYDEATFKKILNTGRGSFNIRATYRFEKNAIIFEEMPYTTTFEAIVDKISQLVKDGKIKDIVDINDIHGINSKGIEVVVKNNTDKELLVEKLFKMTPLQSSFGCNFNIVVNGRPQVLGVKQIIHNWLGFRANAIKRGAEFDKQKKLNKKHLLLALKSVLLDVDKAIKIIRETKKNSEVVANLVKAFKIDEEQAEYVAEIKLRHLNKEYLVQRIAEIKTLEKEIEDLDDLINNKVTLAKLIISQLLDVKKAYGQERKSQIIEATELPEIEKEVIAIDDYNIKVFVTEAGYVKKIPLTSLRGNFNINIKDGDRIISEFETSNNSDILIFTNKQNVYKYKSYEIEDHKPSSSIGEYLPSLLSLKDENILFVTVTNSYKENLLIGFENGKMAKIELKAYCTKQNRKMLKNAYNGDSNPIYFNIINSDIDLVFISNINKVALFNTSLINVKSSKTTQGIQLMKTKNESNVENILEIDKCDFDDLEYYRLNNGGVGKYMKKEDKLLI